MTNYEKIIQNMTVEDLAKMLITERTIFDWNDEFELYFTLDDDQCGFCSEEDAIEAQIKWLKQEVDNG